MSDTGMRLCDWLTFHRAATTFGRWILVRWTNEQSLKYIGRRVWDPASDRLLCYAPKPIDCKPKTADSNVGRYELAGLVIDPTIHKAFAKESKVDKARHAWEKFLHGLGVHNAQELNAQTLSTRQTPLDFPSLKQVAHADATRGGIGLAELRTINQRPADFRGERCFMVDRDPESRHFGCLMLNGAYLHGDYDLKDVIDPTRLGPHVAYAERLHGQPHMRSPEIGAVLEYVNHAIGVPMLQHGGEAQYAPHTDDTVEVFGPKGEAHTLKGRDEIVKWYKFAFQREPIDPKTQTFAGAKYVAPPSQIRVATSEGGVVLSGADQTRK